MSQRQPRHLSVLLFAGFAASVAWFASMPGDDDPAAGATSAGSDGAATATATDRSPSPRSQAAATEPAQAIAPGVTGQSPTTWAEDRVMVRPAGGDLFAVASAAAVPVLRDTGRSGFGSIGVPEGMEPAAFLVRLHHDGLIEGGAPMGRTVGSGLPQIEAVQFGHVRSQLPKVPAAGLSDVIVAVLDTGVAYEDFVNTDGAIYVRAPSLAGSAITAPYDFVNGDAHANDDHQHGTHIASVIASQGDIDGVAPGVGLMPVKVLDADNTGNELDLIEGIYHAADHGADILNLSLSFGADYVPSHALMEAIRHAKSQGAVLVGAAGNAALDEVAWPAASPEVIAVGAYCMKGNTALQHAPYSNRGPGLDVNAPGGCVDLDKYKKDGVPDGVVGETIATNAPEQVGYWLMGGTSQAAAYVSGAVAQMVARGAAAERVDRFLQKTASKWPSHGGFAENNGSGRLRVDAALALADSDFTMEWKRVGRYDLSIMPYLVDNGDGTITPAALVTGVDYKRKRANDTWIYGHLHGEGGGPVSCKLTGAADGTCTLMGQPVSATDGDGQPAAKAWRFTLGAAVRQNNLAFRPNAMIFASDTLDQIADELQADPELADASLAFHWQDEDLGELGQVAESYVVMDSGSGISTSPFGVVLTPPALGPLANVEPGTLDGNGISTSPFGVKIVTVPPFNPIDGSGISTSPFGFKLISLQASDVLGGNGISTSPFGLKKIVSPEPGACPDGCEVFDEDAVLFGDSHIAGPPGLEFHGTALKRQLDKGGWKTAEGAGAATALSASASLGVGANIVGESVGTGAVELVIE